MIWIVLVLFLVITGLLCAIVYYRKTIAELQLAAGLERKLRIDDRDKLLDQLDVVLKQCKAFNDKLQEKDAIIRDLQAANKVLAGGPVATKVHTRARR